MPDPSEPSSPSVWEAWPPWWVYVLLVVVPSTTPILGEGVNLPELLGQAAVGLSGIRELELAGAVTGLALTLAGVLGMIPFLFWIHGRYGAARWGELGLYLRGPLLRHEVFLAWSQIQELREVPAGLQIVPTAAAAPALWTYYPFRPLVPVQGAAREEVLARLAAQVGQEQALESYGRLLSGPRVFFAALVICLTFVLSVLFLDLVIVDSSWGQQVSGFGLLVGCGALAALIGSVGAGVVWTRDTWTRIEVRPGQLTVSSYPFRVGEVASLALEGLVLCAVQAGPQAHRRRGQVRDQAEAEGLRAALVREGFEVADRIPFWGSARRLWAAVVALLVAGVALGTAPAAWAWLAPTSEVSLLGDPLGQNALHVRERGTGRLLLWVFVRPGQDVTLRGLRREFGGRTDFGWDPFEERLTLDLLDWTWGDARTDARGGLAAVVSAQPAAVGSGVLALARGPDPERARAALEAGLRACDLPRGPTLPSPFAGAAGVGRDFPSLPAALERALEGTDPPPDLLDYALGRTSRRCFDIEGGPQAQDDLIAAVVYGEVLWVAAVRRGEPLRLRGEDFSYELGPLGEVPVPRGISSASRAAGAQLLRAEPPTLDDLLAARERVRAGEAPEQALEWLLSRPGAPPR